MFWGIHNINFWLNLMEYLRIMLSREIAANFHL